MTEARPVRFRGTKPKRRVRGTRRTRLRGGELVGSLWANRVQRCSVKCFGTGDGWPSAERRHAAFLHRFGKTSILLDCGEPIDAAYKASGLSYDAIDGIFISHLHSDHFGGFFMLMQGLWLEGRRRDLPIYLPGRAIRAVRQMLRTVFIFDELLPFRPKLLPMREQKPVAVGGVRVTAYCTSHLDGFRAMFQKKYRADFSSYCFLLEGTGRRVGHSSDLGRPEDLEPLLQKPLDLLVCELAHFSPEQIFSYLRGRKIKRVAFVHLARAYRDDLARIRRLAAKMLIGTAHSFPGDGDEIAF